MKSIHAFTIFVIIFVVLAAGASTAHAQTTVFTHDVGDKAQTTKEGKSVFACDATISMETEPQGGWLPNKTYHVNWTLRLDYVNSEILNGSNFYILYSWPPLETITPTIPAETIVNETRLSLAYKTGTISAAFTPTNTSDGFFMNPDFPFVVYVNGKPLSEDWASGIWYGDGSTATNIVNPDATATVWPPQNSGEFPTFQVAVGVSAGVLFGICASVAVRKLK
ncbi:MAG: hypothetical protein ACQCN4_00790 [Candidatus Bathyarchaeia archaeon]|jgi:hypothetical protein